MLYKRGIIMQSVILLILFLSILMQFVSSVFNVLLQHHWQLRDSFSLMCFQSSHPWIRTHQLFSEELVIPFLKHQLAIFKSEFYFQLSKFYFQLWCGHLGFLLVPHSLLSASLNSLVSQIPTDSPIFSSYC